MTATVTKKVGYILRVNGAEKYHGMMYDLRDILDQLLRAGTDDLLEVVNATNSKVERKYSKGTLIH